MDTFELFERMSVALAVGLLIGLERGWQSRAELDGERAAGLRTFALAGLLGGVWGVIAARFPNSGGVLALALAFTVFSAAIVVFMVRELARENTYSATSAVAAMLTFGFGALAAIGEPQAAAAAGVVTAGLLAAKSIMHGWIKRLTWEELRSALVLLAMTFIMLPLLPDRTVDPWGSLNPHTLWLLTILIAAMSFAGYIAIKATGDDRGILLTGLAGGLDSSTAVTLSLARFSRGNPGQEKLLVAGMLAASATMMARVIAIVGIVNPWMLVNVGPAALAAGGVLAVGALALMRRPRGQTNHGNGLAVSNPFDLATVLQFGLLLTAITLGAKIATAIAGQAGAYVLAAASGIADVDAISLSMAQLGGGTVSPATGANAILMALGVNTCVKAGMSWVAGGAKIGRWMAMVSGLAIVAGVTARTLSGMI